MSIRTITLTVAVAADANNTLIGSLIPPKGEKWTILTMAAVMADAGQIVGTMREEVTDELDDFLLPPISQPAIKNNELNEGDIYKFVGSDDSSAVNRMSVFLVYDVVKVK